MQFIQWLEKRYLLGPVGLAAFVFLVAVLILVSGVVLNVDPTLVFQTITATLGIGGMAVILASLWTMMN